MYSFLRKSLWPAYAFGIMVMLVFANKSVAQANDFVGSYGHSEMEYAEQMHILKSHRFSWQQVYGAVNRDIRGKWSVKHDTLHLILDPLPDKKKPGEMVAVLTNAGDFKIVKAFGKTVTHPKILKRFNNSLPSKKATAFAKPIDYKKLKKRAKERRIKRRQERKKEKKRYGRYDGYFENSEKTIAISLYGREQQFVGKTTDPDKKQADAYFQGSFEIRKDTAYATTYAEQDEIKVYGNRTGGIPEGGIEVYLRDLDPEKVKIKAGSTYAGANFISSAKFNKKDDSLYALHLKKSDSLWVAVGQRDPIVYSFGIRRMKNNAILVQPNADRTVTWVDHPIYVTKRHEIHGLLSHKSTFKQKPGKRIPSPVAAPPTYPRLNGKTYAPIQRATLFNDKNN
jgi:hypothetical protein